MDLDWRQRRLIAFLSAVLGILVVAVLIVGGFRYRQHRQRMAAAAAEGTAAAAATQHTYTALSYSDGSATLSFTVDPETDRWTWADDPDFPLDDTTVTELCQLAANLKPQQTLTPDGTMESYQLDESQVFLSLTDASGAVTTLTFGKTTTDGTSYYALKNGDESTVYIYDGAVVEKLSVPIYSMMELPVLPALTGKTLVSITFDGEVPTVLTAQRSDGGGEEEATWRSGGANVTDSPAVQGLLRELETLTLDRCVDYKPTAEAVSLCGFDTPAAQVEAVYRTEGGAEQAFTLTVGAQSLGGSGRYIRIGGDDTVYEAAADSLANILAIAASGLEG